MRPKKTRLFVLLVSPLTPSRLGKLARRRGSDADQGVQATNHYSPHYRWRYMTLDGIQTAQTIKAMNDEETKRKKQAKTKDLKKSRTTLAEITKNAPTRPCPGRGDTYLDTLSERIVDEEIRINRDWIAEVPRTTREINIELFSDYDPQERTQAEVFAMIRVAMEAAGFHVTGNNAWRL